MNHTEWLTLQIESYPFSDEPNEFTVKTKEKDFSISHYPLEQSKFLYDMLEAKKKFGGEINKSFDYTLFHYRQGSKSTVWPEYDGTSNEKFPLIHWNSAQLKFVGHSVNILFSSF